MSSVTEYYESTLNRLWTHLTQGQVHLGYWDEGQEQVDFRQATRRLTQLMVDQTSIGSGQRFLDLGCGMGWPALELVKARECSVEGVTLSPWQQQQAQRLASDHGLTERMRFQVMDALHLDFAEASFDGAWFFESIFHMGHTEALREAARVLKPGAELTLSDCVDVGRMSDQDKEFARQVANVNYIEASAYPDLLEQCGFELIELRDITDRVMGPFEERFAEAIAEHHAELAQIAGDDQGGLEALAGISGALVRTVGYVLVKARRKG